MIEYVFFHRQAVDLFLRFLAEQGLEAETQQHSDRLEVQLPDDLDSALFDKIDTRYDQLMKLEADLTDAEQSGQAGEYETGGIVVNLTDGTTVYADLDSQLLARIMQVITPGEFAVIVDAIAKAVENRQEQPGCQRN